MNKKIIATIIALMAVFTFALAGCSPESGTQDNTVPQQDIINDFSTEIVNTQNVLLSMGSVTTMSSGSVSKTLTATVLPETATNKAVDWSCEWDDSENTANVSEYVTVTPASDGSATATVTCYQAFTGTVIITVTTRESGYSATCVISFLGIPTDINISGSIVPTGGAYKVGIGDAYEFTVTLTNPFNSVGSQFNNITCGVSGVGSVVLGYMEHYNTSNTDVWFDASNKTVTLDSLKDNFISVSYSGNQLTITTIKSIESYYLRTERLDSGRTRGYVDKFRSFVDDCYFKVWIKENTSGLTKEITVRFDESIVTGVTVDSGEIFF